MQKNVAGALAYEVTEGYGIAMHGTKQTKPDPLKSLRISSTTHALIAGYCKALGLKLNQYADRVLRAHCDAGFPVPVASVTSQRKGRRHD